MHVHAYLTVDNMIYEVPEQVYVVHPRPYEIPVSSVSAARSVESHYEFDEPQYSVPVVFKYATFGPNEGSLVMVRIVMHA